MKYVLLAILLFSPSVFADQWRNDYKLSCSVHAMMVMAATDEFRTYPRKELQELSEIACGGLEKRLNRIDLKMTGDMAGCIDGVRVGARMAKINDGSVDSKLVKGYCLK